MILQLLYALCLAIASLFGAENSSPLQPAEQSIVAQTAEPQKTPSVKKVVVFDFGQVLGVHSEDHLRWNIGWKSFRKNGLRLLMHLDDLKRAVIKPLFFRLLEEAADYPEEYERMYDDNDEPCPKGLCALNAGLMSLKDLRTNALDIIDRWEKEDESLFAQGLCRKHFVSDVQANMLRSIIETITHEKTLARSYSKLPGVEILRSLLGKPGVEVMIFSNFPVEQFQELKRKMHKVFEGIPEQNIFVSGMDLSAEIFGLDENNLPFKLAIKPNVSGFEAITRVCKAKWDIDPSDVIMIDNQRKNIEGAQKAGMTAFLVNSQTNGTEYNYTFDELQNKLIAELESSNNPQAGPLDTSHLVPHIII